MTRTAAIIGCGSIATAHAYGFAASGMVDLVGLADIHRGALDELGQRCGVREAGRFTDYRAMLDAVRPDIAVICLWHELHTEAIQAAASRGVGVILCEKPIAGDLGAAQARWWQSGVRARSSPSRTSAGSLPVGPMPAGCSPTERSAGRPIGPVPGRYLVMPSVGEM